MIEVAHTYNYVIYNAGLLDDKGQLWTGHRISVMALKPLTHKIMTLREVTDKQIESGGEVPIVMGLLEAANMGNIITFEHPDGEEGDTFLLGTDFGQLIPANPFKGPLKVISSHTDFVEYEDDVPMIYLRTLAPGLDPSKVEVKQIENAKLLEDAIARVDFLADGDRKYGYNSRYLQHAEKVKREGQLLREMLKRSPEDVQMERLPDGNIGVIVEAEGERFAAASLTDFRDVRVTEKGQKVGKEAQAIRLAHVTPPVWHATPDDADGYIGYWEFSDAILGQRVPGEREDGAVLIGYTPMPGVQIAVKSADAINPGGQMALPVPVLIAATGKQPEQTMSLEEGRKFTSANALTMADAMLATASSN